MKDPRTAFRPNHSNGVRRTLIKRSLAAGALFFTLSSTSLPLWAAAGRTKRAAPRIVVLYFSATGTTKRAAETIARMTGAPIWRIEPEVPYPDKMRAVADKVKADEKAGIRVRPKAPLPEALRNADIYIIGSPVWSGTMPAVLADFLRSEGFAGKRILPFTTHMGSNLGDIPEAMAAACPQAQVAPGLALRAPADDTIRPEVAFWLKQTNARP